MANISQLNRQRTEELFERNSQSSFYNRTDVDGVAETQGDGVDNNQIESTPITERPAEAAPSTDSGQSNAESSEKKQKDFAAELRNLKTNGNLAENLDPTGLSDLKKIEESGVLGAAASFAAKRGKMWVLGLIAAALPYIAIGGTIILTLGLFYYRYPRLAGAGLWIFGKSANGFIWLFTKFLYVMY